MNKKDVPIFITTTETSELSRKYGFMGAYAVSERGGLSLVIPPLTQGLVEELGYHNVHVVIPNLKNAFAQNKENVDRSELEARLHVPERYIHFVESDHIRNLRHIYDESCVGGHERTLALFQSKAAFLIKDNLGFYDKKGIHISNDGTGGYLNAFLKTKRIPTLHMVHNLHTRNIPLTDYLDTPKSNYEENFFLTRGDPTRLASTETSIKNARFVGVVGDTFKQELVSRKLDKYFTSPDVLNELLIKHDHDQLVSLPNGYHPKLLPEDPEHQARIFNSRMIGEAGGSWDQSEPVIKRKERNLLAFQKLTRTTRKKEWSPGLPEDKDAILYFWPSRLDTYQKGAQHLYDAVSQFLPSHPKAQFAVIADTSDEKSGLEEQMRQLATEFPEQFYYSTFHKKMSDFTFSASQVVVSAPSFEPFGYYILQGFAAGNFLIGTKTGGCLDMIVPYNDTMHTGNGFFIQDQVNIPESQSLEIALRNSYEAISGLQQNPELYEQELQRIMVDVREKYGVKGMIKNYEPVIDKMVSEVLGNKKTISF